MPVTQLPLMKGLGKSFVNADYLDMLPVNLLATPKEVLSSNGYMRSFPALTGKTVVDGTSRAVQYNTAVNAVFRVLGGKLYRSGVYVSDVPGSNRVGMAHSATSQAMAVDGQMRLYRYGGSVKVLDNWPAERVTTPESDKTIATWTSTNGLADTNRFSVNSDNSKGVFVITITPTLSNGLTGDPLEISESQWGLSLSQDSSDTKPYLTSVVVSGRPSAGELVKISYTINIPSGVTATNTTQFVVVQHIDEVVTEYAQYDIGSVKDICRLRGRYIWVKDGTDTFGVTDLEDESHPDQFRPFYQAESQPDGIQACAAWRDFAVMFGTSTIEYFSLTGATSTTSAIYVAQPSLMVSKGIAGTYCKAAFAESFAFISHPSGGAPSVYVINSGQSVNIATATIEKILRSYSAEELSHAVMESVRFDSHELLLIHLSRHVLCYDAAASSAGNFQWTTLKTGLFDGVYRAIDFAYEGRSISVGDKKEAIAGTLDFDSSGQYGDDTEHLLYTPLFKADNARVFDFEVESSTGLSQLAQKIFISSTTDGINFGREQMLAADETFNYDRRVLWRRIGRIRKNIGFKLRIITSTPVTLSGCSVRVE